MNLLGTHASHADLKPFAKALFEALEIEDSEKRESSNYVGGYYLKGTYRGIAFIVARSDDAAHEDLPYWIHISSDVAKSDDLEIAVSQLVRSKALPAGFRLAHIVNFGKQGEQRIDY